jgi:hypothetical protein
MSLLEDRRNQEIEVTLGAIDIFELYMTTVRRHCSANMLTGY